MRWMLRPVAAVLVAALALAGGPQRADAQPERRGVDVGVT